jgi:hypothetical protein
VNNEQKNDLSAVFNTSRQHRFRFESGQNFSEGYLLLAFWGRKLSERAQAGLSFFRSLEAKPQI